MVKTWWAHRYPTLFNTAHPGSRSLQIKYVVQVNCRLQVAYTAYVLSCSTCGRESLHEGRLEYIMCGRREGFLLMSFEEGSIVHPAAT